MVIDSVKGKIAQVFVSNLKKFGFKDEMSFKVEDYWDDLCTVSIPTALEALGQEFFDAIAAELEGMDEIANVYDNGAYYGPSKGELRRFEITVNRDFWEKSDYDLKKDTDFRRQYEDPEYAKECRERERLERLEHWKDYILPIPEAPKNCSTELFLTMAYEPYDWIKNSEKTTEFRAYTPNYAKRLLSHPIKTVKFQRGYGGPGRPFPEQMTWEVKRIDLYDIETRTSADPFNPTPIVPTHFAIELGRRIK